jgi:hypothetical protein
MNNLKEGRFILVHGFEISVVVTGLHVFEPGVKQYIMVEEQETDRERACSGWLPLLLLFHQGLSILDSATHIQGGSFLLS